MASAYALAIRNNNCLEVLLAQKNVIDFRRTLRANNSTLYLCEHPGEYVIPGGDIPPGEAPDRAVLRAFCEGVQVELPRRATVQKFYGAGGESQFWLLWADKNPWMRLDDDRELQKKNRYFMERDGAVSLDESGRLVSNWSPEHYGELHLLQWLPIGDALGKFNPNDSLSDWQEGQYALARRAMPAYDNYNLIWVYNHERAFPTRSERALQHLVQNTMFTNIQIYRDRHRKHPVLLGGSGQIIYSRGLAHVRGERSTVIAEPVLDHCYFVVAYNGPEIVLFQTMSYVGKSRGQHRFSASAFADKSRPGARASAEPDILPEE